MLKLNLRKTYDIFISTIDTMVLQSDIANRLTLLQFHFRGNVQDTRILGFHVTSDFSGGQLSIATQSSD